MDKMSDKWHAVAQKVGLEKRSDEKIDNKETRTLALRWFDIVYLSILFVASTSGTRQHKSSVTKAEDPDYFDEDKPTREHSYKASSDAPDGKSKENNENKSSKEKAADKMHRAADKLERKGL